MGLVYVQALCLRIRKEGVWEQRPRRWLMRKQGWKESLGCGAGQRGGALKRLMREEELVLAIARSTPRRVGPGSQ